MAKSGCGLLHCFLKQVLTVFVDLANLSFGFVWSFHNVGNDEKSSSRQILFFILSFIFCQGLLEQLHRFTTPAPRKGVVKARDRMLAR
jgi:hypothetical protein